MKMGADRARVETLIRFSPRSGAHRRGLSDALGKYKNVFQVVNVNRYIASA